MRKCPFDMILNKMRAVSRLVVLLVCCGLGFAFFKFYKYSKASRNLEIKWGHWKENIIWPDDKSCGHFKTRIAREGSVEVMALASYPGSGNTWIRYLIEGASGMFTGSIYNDQKIYQAGHWGENRNYLDGTTILQKTHHRSLYSLSNKTLQWRINHIKKFKGRAVLVIRNPFDAILSYYNYRGTHSHTKKLNSSAFLTPKFKDFAYTGITRWYELIEDWIDYGTQVHIVFYEDLKESPVRVITDLLTSIGFRLDGERIDCLIKNTTGSFHRLNHNEVNPFSEDLKSIFRTVISMAVEKILPILELQDGMNLLKTG